MNRLITLIVLACLSFLFIIAACAAQQSDRLIITMWQHHMVSGEREAIDAEIGRFRQLHPEIDVRALSKSGYESAALDGIGPDLVYGPSDAVELFQSKRIIQDMTPWISKTQQQQFGEGSLIKLPGLDDSSKEELLLVGGRVGNHLALVFNQNYVSEPPQTTEDLIQIAKQQTIDEDQDGRPERYGLVWNCSEPFFAVPFLTGCGAWVFDENSPGVPNLDTPEAIAAYALIHRIVNKELVTPPNCDYAIADALFKDGKAAMIINGDWSWSDYLGNPKLNAAVAVLPAVSGTGIPMRPMVAPIGYSLNANAKGERADAAMLFVQYMTSEEVQRRLVKRLRIVSSLHVLYEEALSSSDKIFTVSVKQVERGRPMPVEYELRAIFDSMRPALRALLQGELTPEEAGKRMQIMAERRISEMKLQ